MTRFRIQFTICFFAILFLLPNFSWSQQDSTKKLIEPSLGYMCDIGRNFSGGIEQGNAYAGLVYGGITLHTDRFWKGGELTIEAMNTHGHGMSSNYTGDIQVISNIENGDYTFIYQLKYKQSFGNGYISIGIQDLNADFAGSEYGGALTNSSFGIHSSFPLNFTVSIYPKNALGMALDYQFNDQFAFRTGIYDADAGSLEEDEFNTDWTVEEVMSISELEFNSGKSLNTTIKLGGYYISGTYQDYSDTLKTSDGNFGFYAVLDQMLINRETRGLGLFAQISGAPKGRNFNTLYTGLGLNLTAPFAKRQDDVLACGLAYAKIYNDKYECDIELNYNLCINKYISVQPALHYIINPGADQELDNAFAAFLRINAGF